MKQVSKVIKNGVTYYFADSALTQSVDNIVDTLNNLSIPDSTSDLINDSGFLDSSDFKTINNESIVGSGNIDIQGGGVTVSSITQDEYDDLPSSAKTDDIIWIISDVVIPSGGAEYTAGDNIDITDDVISVTGMPTNLSDLNDDVGYVTQLELADVYDTIPTDVSQLNNDSGYLTSSDFKTINNQSIVGSGNINIQGGGGSYTAGANIDITNDVISVTGITVPTKTSDLTNDSNYVASTNLKTINTQSIVGSGNINIPSGVSVSSLTQDEYDELTPEEKANGTIWIITDVNPSSGVVYTAGTNIDITNDVISVTGITVPTDVSDLNNDSGYLTSSDFKTINYQSIVGSGNINIQGGGGGGGITIVELSQSDYDDLPESAKTDTSYLYVISGATSNYYTKTEVNALIPTKTSSLTNDSGFLTSSSLKTVGGQSVVGSGNIGFKTINNSSIVGSGNVVVPTFTYDLTTQTLNITTS